MKGIIYSLLIITAAIFICLMIGLPIEVTIGISYALGILYLIKRFKTYLKTA